MNTPLDNAITKAAAAEATYAADVANVDTIKGSIASATAPLDAAQSQANADAAAYNSALDDLIAAATASKVQIPTS